MYHSPAHSSSSSSATAMDTSDDSRTSQCEWFDALASDQKDTLLDIASCAATLDELKHSHSLLLIAFAPARAGSAVPTLSTALLCASGNFKTTSLMAEESPFRNALVPHVKDRWNRDRTVFHLAGTKTSAWNRARDQISACLNRAESKLAKLKLPAVLVHSNGTELFLHGSSSAQAARSSMVADTLFCTTALDVRRELPPASSDTAANDSSSKGSSSSSTRSSGAKRAAMAPPGVERSAKLPKAVAQPVQLPPFEQYYASALKFLVTPSLFVISSALDVATTVSARAFTVLRKFTDEWRCDCNAWRRDSHCDHTQSAQRQELEREPSLTLDEACALDVVPISPMRIWAAGSSSYKQVLVVVNDRAQVSSTFSPDFTIFFVVVIRLFIVVGVLIANVRQVV